jgi:hypothetical protein
VKRAVQAKLTSRPAGLNSVRSDLFIETPATHRPTPAGAASHDRANNVPPLRGLRFFLCDLATNMSLLAEFWFVTEYEVTA